MREVKLIVIHCSATPEGRDIIAADIDQMHAARGFSGIGYHRFVRLDGTIERGRPDSVPGAHVKGHNFDSIGICYAGGLAGDGKIPKDTRTQAQKAALGRLVDEYRKLHPKARVCGHRDLSPDRDGDGIVRANEWIKACPCFDVAGWLREREAAAPGDAA